MKQLFNNSTKKEIRKKIQIRKERIKVVKMILKPEEIDNWLKSLKKITFEIYTNVGSNKYKKHEWVKKEYLLEEHSTWSSNKGNKVESFTYVISFNRKIIQKIDTLPALVYEKISQTKLLTDQLCRNFEISELISDDSLYRSILKKIEIGKMVMVRNLEGEDYPRFTMDNPKIAGELIMQLRDMVMSRKINFLIRATLKKIEASYGSDDWHRRDELMPDVVIERVLKKIPGVKNIKIDFGVYKGGDYDFYVFFTFDGYLIRMRGTTGSCSVCHAVGNFFTFPIDYLKNCLTLGNTVVIKPL